VILDNVGNRPLRRLRRALAPAGTLVLNGGGSPGHVFGPVAGIVRAVVVNGLVRERLRLIPHEQKRDQLLTLTGLIEAGKFTPVLDRTYPLSGTAEGLRRVEQGHARGSGHARCGHREIPGLGCSSSLRAKMPMASSHQQMSSPRYVRGTRV
jgi:NADPH:quinone reductase-like Zn-dependent oxidoreductase